MHIVLFGGVERVKLIISWRSHIIRHVYYRGFEFLVRAMREVRDDVVLVLGGRAPLTGPLRELTATARPAPSRRGASARG